MWLQAGLQALALLAAILIAVEARALLLGDGPRSPGEREELRAERGQVPEPAPHHT